MSIANIMAKEPFFLGDYVLDDYGRRGRVVAIHNGCPADTAWLAGQQRPFSQEEIDS